MTIKFSNLLLYDELDEENSLRSDCNCSKSIDNCEKTFSNFDAYENRLDFNFNVSPFFDYCNTF